MFKIGLFGSTVTSPIVLAAVNWPDAINTAANSTNATTSSGLITWATTQLTVNLRIVSSNIQENPFLSNTSGIFRVITNTSNTLTGATITTYTSLDFVITVPKNTYVWFRLGPSEVVRDVAVYNASNGDTFVDAFTITAGPFVNPILGGLIADARSFTISNHVYTLQTVQMSNVPTSTSIYLNWYLTSGSNLPRIFYAKNYPGITGVGSTTIGYPIPTTLTPNTFTPPFTEVVTPGNGTLISVANGDFITFATLSTSPSYISYNTDSAYLEIYYYTSPTTSQILANANIKTIDF
jgi:hypothetical protein